MGLVKMNQHALFALATPVYNPEEEITPEHFWLPQKHISAGLTVNIGME